MEEYPCIICLLVLPTEEDPRLEDDSEIKEQYDTVSEKQNNISVESLDDSGEVAVYDGTNDIARLVPCGHLLHNACIKMWIEQATSKF